LFNQEKKDVDVSAAMEYRSLGRTGMKVSELCLGTMQFGWTADEATSLHVLDAAYERGINFFDTADVYSRWVDGNPGGVSETILGKWLKGGSVQRERLILATKVRAPMGEDPNEQGLSRMRVMTAARDSLRRLGVDAIDLYQLHWPDEETPIDETLRALDDLVRMGDVRYIGCSNFPAWRLVQALWASDRHNLVSFVSLQPHYNLVHRDEYEAELKAVCTHYGLGVLPYSPLAGGFLTGKYSPEEPAPVGSRGTTSMKIQRYMQEERHWRLIHLLGQLGTQRGKSVSQMALGWLLSHPEVTSPIIGPRSLEQLDDNLGAVSLRLDEEELIAIDQIGKALEE
jgi:aryl-alcohol dehydrogenase-like predicted oxidoreductase